jgi:hypothetical protein
MIKYTQEFYRKQFKGKNIKDSYLIAAKWVATNIISDKRFDDVVIRYEKDMLSGSVIVSFYTGLNENIIRNKHCQICKEMHKAFFINENCNCEWCNTKAYQNRTDQMVAVKTGYYRSILMNKGKSENEN